MACVGFCSCVSDLLRLTASLSPFKMMRFSFPVQSFKNTAFILICQHRGRGHEDGRVHSLSCQRAYISCPPAPPPRPLSRLHHESLIVGCFSVRDTKRFPAVEWFIETKLWQKETPLWQMTAWPLPLVACVCVCVFAWTAGRMCEDVLTLVCKMCWLCSKVQYLLVPTVASITFFHYQPF